MAGTDSGTTTPLLVNNRYEAHLRRCLSQAQDCDGDVSSALKEVRKLMTAGAWESASADAFYTDVTGRQNAAKGGSGGCVSEIQTAISREPDKVPAASWQVHYHKL